MLKIFLIFLRLGAVGFGGPIALIALIEEEVCQRQHWLTEKEFAQIFSVCKLLPGAVAVQIAIYCGYQQKGRLGGIVSGLAFTLPAIIMMFILSIFYLNGSHTKSPLIYYLFEFMQTSTIAIIALATMQMGKSYVKNISGILITIISGIIIYFYPSYEPIVILGFGFSEILLYSFSHKSIYQLPVFAIAPAAKFSLLTNPNLLYGKLIKLFWICLKTGEFAFGTGLAIIPLLHADLVTNTHWLTNNTFIDGVTLGQITPGPTTVSVVFFGFAVAGFPGFIVSLLGFYIPAFFNVLVLIPLLWNKLTSSPYLDIFTQWAFPAVIGGIVSATFKLGLNSITKPLDLGLTILAFLLAYKKIVPVWLIIPLYGVCGIMTGFLV